MEVATLTKDVLEQFTKLVLEGKTLRGIREVMSELPPGDIPLIRLMLQILEKEN